MLGMNRQRGAHAPQIPVVAAARVIAREHQLLQRGAGDRRLEVGA
jgi:hypothetical protein